ncbi:hypothetical protein B0T16DRAFT_496027 [Cercophora newfieldiana]|uniref:Uncharacterized protein n=1 Tax=Cercophora newfieldiana TaxID=92897 RepID=A0AA39XWV9_9PEZI|nr:hypothetical protein B0T16DRAFT_496027 [Cercophora newfieldiana]
MTNPIIYAIVLLVLLIILFVGLVYYTVLTHRNIHSRNDPARTAFPHFRSTLHFFLGGTLFNVVTIAIILSLWNSPDYDYDRRTVNAINHISFISALLNSLASCTLIFTTAHLATGVRRAASGGSYNPRKIHFTVNILAGLAALLWVVFFIGRQVRLSQPGSGTIVSFVFAVLGLAGFVLLLIAAITVLVYAYRARKAVRELAVGGGYKGLMRRVLAVAWVNLVLFAWMIVSGILAGFGFGSSVGFWDILDVLVRQFGTFGLLVGVYYLGRMEKGGLWSSGIQGVEGLPLAVTGSNDVRV